MKDITLIYQKLDPSQSKRNRLIDDLILDLEINNFKDHEDLLELAKFALKELMIINDFSLSPTIIATTIFDYETICDVALSDFDKAIIGRLVYKLYFGSAIREN